MIRYVYAPVYEPFADQLGIATKLAVRGEFDPAGGPARPPAGESRAYHGQNAVAITFDDGPHPQGTPQILDLLAERGALATFFVVGEQVVQRPQLLARIVAEGHALALHGYRHHLHLRQTPQAMAEDFRRGIAAIEDAAGVTPTRHRPPYGIYSPWSLRLAREHGLEPLLWSSWGKDWRRFTSPGRIARHALNGLVPGGVMLLHDADFYSAEGSHQRTAAALVNVLVTLKSAGVDTVLAV